MFRLIYIVVRLDVTLHRLIRGHKTDAGAELKVEWIQTDNDDKEILTNHRPGWTANTATLF